MKYTKKEVEKIVAEYYEGEISLKDIKIINKENMLLNN